VIVEGVVGSPLVEGKEGEVEAFAPVLPEGIVALPVAVLLLLMPFELLLWLNPAVPEPSFAAVVVPSLAPPPPQAIKRTQRNTVVIGFKVCSIYTPLQVRVSSLKCIVIGGPQ
jgi:hypothetical protein